VSSSSSTHWPTLCLATSARRNTAVCSSGGGGGRGGEGGGRGQGRVEGGEEGGEQGKQLQRNHLSCRHIAGCVRQKSPAACRTPEEAAWWGATLPSATAVSLQHYSRQSDAPRVDLAVKSALQLQVLA
jgi:hypothetical protein